jgi:hypothetical protein
LNAFRPKTSTNEESLEINFCGLQAGNANEYKPSKTAAAPAM